MFFFHIRTKVFNKPKVKDMLRPKLDFKNTISKIQDFINVAIHD